MSDLTYTLKGDKEAGIVFDDFPETARPYLRGAIEDLIGQLYASVNAVIPRGKTGQLAAELARFVDDLADGVKGSVAIDAGKNTQQIIKAIALEYGAHGTASVAGHIMSLDHVFNRIMTPMRVVVSEYSRTVNIQEVDYLRGPLRAIADQAVTRIKQALDQAAIAAAD